MATAVTNPPNDLTAPVSPRILPNGKPSLSKLRMVWGATPFILIHLLAFGALWTGVNTIDVVVAVALYYIRMFGVTAGYHRYFSHRTYKMGRVAQFCMAFLAQSSSQKGALWWAAHHRHHHKYSDEPEDVHSPRQRGMFYAHVGWLFDDTQETDYSKIKDFAKYPELVWLNKYWVVPPAVLGFAVWLWLGWSGLFIGFMASTVALWHGTFTINSLSHVFGKRVYETTDDSRNSMILALITCGEGWHNNHHYYQASTRQGFEWWQIDMSYYVLKMLSWVGIVWDIREPPQKVLDGSWRHKRVDGATAPSAGESPSAADMSAAA